MPVPKKLLSSIPKLTPAQRRMFYISAVLGGVGFYWTYSRKLSQVSSVALVREDLQKRCKELEKTGLPGMDSNELSVYKTESQRNAQIESDYYNGYDGTQGYTDPLKSPAGKLGHYGYVVHGEHLSGVRLQTTGQGGKPDFDPGENAGIFYGDGLFGEEMTYQEGQEREPNALGYKSVPGSSITYNGVVLNYLARFQLAWKFSFEVDVYIHPGTTVEERHGKDGRMKQFISGRMLAVTVDGKHLFSGVQDKTYVTIIDRETGNAEYFWMSLEGIGFTDSPPREWLNRVSIPYVFMYAFSRLKQHLYGREYRSEFMTELEQLMDEEDKDIG